MRIVEAIKESIELKQQILNDKSIQKLIQQVVDECVGAFRSDRKVLFCGNGGSAADAQHLAAELAGKFYFDRPPLFSEALHVNTSYLTAVANDYSYDETFARLVQAKGKMGDVLIGISTSGNSQNVVNAMVTAKKMGMKTVGLTGEGGGNLKEYCDLLIAVPSKDTPRIQETHILIGHIICELVESKIFPR